MRALTGLAAPVGAWDMEDQVSSALADGEQFLLAIFGANRFEDAVWDTAVAVRALNGVRRTSGEFIRDRIAWLLAVSPDALNAGPHHLAQRALAFAECGVDRAQVLEAAGVAADRVVKDIDRYSPYVLAQCLDALNVAGDTDRAERLRAPLLAYLEHAHLDSANFVSICATLDALKPVLVEATAERVRLSVASLFGETCFRDDGTWYHDELSTAWALIALTRFTREVVIRAPKSQLVADTAQALRTRDDEIGRDVRIGARNQVITAALLFGGGLGGGAYVVATTLCSLPAWVDWAAPTTCVAAIGVAVRYIARCYASADEAARD
jgi:hypothetical protein